MSDVVENHAISDPCDPHLAQGQSAPGEVVVLTEHGTEGGPCYEYRGAAIHANASSTVHKYRLADRPGCEGGDWLTAASLCGAIAAIDGWFTPANS